MILSREYQTGKLQRHGKNFVFLEVLPLNIAVGIKRGYSPIEDIALGVAETIPRLKGFENVIPLVLCAQGSYLDKLETIQTVPPMGKWVNPEERAQNKDRYEKHFSMINHINADIIHNHTTEFPHYFLSHPTTVPIVNTIHVDYKTEQLQAVNHEHIIHVALSEAHRKELQKQGVEVSEVIYNGIDVDSIDCVEKKENYVLSMGRMTPGKGHADAILAARAAGYKIVVAGIVQDKPEDIKYFNEQIKPHIELELDFEKNPQDFEAMVSSDKKVIFGTRLGNKKYELFGRAKAFLFPILWPEPFGLTMVEALATGTPVIAYNRASVPEIIKDREVGYIVNNVDELATSIRYAGKISPHACRTHAHQFSTELMAGNYAKLFSQLLEDRLHDEVHRVTPEQRRGRFPPF